LVLHFIEHKCDQFSVLRRFDLSPLAPLPQGSGYTFCVSSAISPHRGILWILLVGRKEKTPSAEANCYGKRHPQKLPVLQFSGTRIDGSKKSNPIDLLRISRPKHPQGESQRLTAFG
jgi:hypothetical protein